MLRVALQPGVDGGGAGTAVGEHGCIGEGRPGQQGGYFRGRGGPLGGVGAFEGFGAGGLSFEGVPDLGRGMAGWRNAGLVNYMNTFG